jgi:hypothetical protein
MKAKVKILIIMFIFLSCGTESGLNVRLFRPDLCYMGISHVRKGAQSNDGIIDINEFKQLQGQCKSCDSLYLDAMTYHKLEGNFNKFMTDNPVEKLYEYNAILGPNHIDSIITYFKNNYENTIRAKYIEKYKKDYSKIPLN